MVKPPSHNSNDLSTDTVGRFAPSPTGALHLGSLVAAVASYMIAKQAGGQWLVRIEDIDLPREVPGAAKQILQTLEDFGLHWDESVVYQSQRNSLYVQTYKELIQNGFVYHCDCSRKTVENRNAGVYDQHCRRLNKRQSSDIASRVKFCADYLKFHDQILGDCYFDSAQDKQDFVIKRRDGLFAYQLAVVVDDIAQGVTQVVRGADILDSTPRQNFLYACLNKVAPTYYHLPLVLDRDGNKDFRSYDQQKFNSSITGIPADYREKLAKRGFKLIQDSKGIDIELSIRDKQMLQTYQKITQKIEGPAECVDGLAATYECHNIDLQSHIPLNELSTRPSSASDIWGFVDLNNQREYAIMGLQNGTVVIDVTDPVLPVEVGSITGTASTWRDVKVYQYFDNASSEYKAYAYITTEANNQGLQILDLNDLPNQVTLAATINEFSSAHNVYMSNTNYADGTALDNLTPYLFIEGANLSGGAFRAYDLTDPVNPILVSQPPSGTGYVHDATSLVITDSRTDDCHNGHNPCELFVDFNERTVDIWDMTDTNAPTRLSSTGYSGAQYTHSGWWSDDKMTIFIQDELDEQRSGLNTTLRALDISDLLNPQIIGTYTGQTPAIDHNGFTLGNYYYMSNYRRGLSVLDVSDPSDMKDVALFDTFAVPADNSANFNGAWGVFPYLPSGNLIVSDIEYGLFVLKLNENDGDFPNASDGNSGGGSAGGGNNDNDDSSDGGGGSLGLWLVVIAALVRGRHKYLN